MIKTALSICAAVCALTPSFAFMQPMANAEDPPVAEARYSSDFQGGEFEYVVNRQVYYATRSIESYENPYKLPRYISGIASACAVNAGGVAITYNDRIYDNLIPNYAPKQTSIRFSYGTQSQAVDDMFSALYSLMGTNSQGTTISGFKNGMTSYVNQRGYSLSLPQATGSYYNLNMDYLKSQLRQEKIAVLFIHSFSLVPTVGIQTKDGYDEIMNFLYDGYHTVPVYGYKEYHYYDVSGNLSQTDTYLYVQNCYEDAGYNYLSVNTYSTIDDAYIIDIH
ncbi:MAG: hypothetical protein NC184_05370 [Roseburia sp.]|nr:hypothetical protein [Roseburia sp.]